MKKGLIVLIVIVVVILGLYSWVKGNYNTMVTQGEKVTAQWSNVENQYQRRLSLIPNLVNTVKGYAAHEEKTFTEVIKARSQATQTHIDINNADEATLAKFNKVQGDLSSALSKLMVVSENYPNLKANENFLELQSQLEGTENRIAVERRKFNLAVKEYNTYIKRFPNNIFAGMFNFEGRPYFKAEVGAEKTPEVKF